MGLTFVLGIPSSVLRWGSVSNSLLLPRYGHGSVILRTAKFFNYSCKFSSLNSSLVCHWQCRSFSNSVLLLLDYPCCCRGTDRSWMWVWQSSSMKCRSVACIWSGAPPLHRITATAVLNRPPTLYTGGSDGSIIWWNLSGDEFEPVYQFNFDTCLSCLVSNRFFNFFWAIFVGLLTLLIDVVVSFVCDRCMFPFIVWFPLQITLQHNDIVVDLLLVLKISWHVSLKKYANVLWQPTYQVAIKTETSNSWA